MECIKISIVIPYYNILKELEICLQSLHKQSFSKELYEVIIVDDGSTKSPDTVVRKYQKKIKNIRKIKLRHNRGPGIARNKGIRKAKGLYIFFLDADDMLPTYSLQKLYDMILKKNADVITFNWAYLGTKKEKKILKPMRKDYVFFTSNKNKFIRLFISMHFNNSVIFTMCKREIFLKNKILFPTGYHEDISVLFQICLYAKKIVVEKKIMYLKNNRKKSIINSLTYSHINGFFKSWLIIKKIIIKQKGLIYFKKKLIKYYIKGVVGLIAIMILRNIRFNKKKLLFKIKFYQTILKKVKIFFLDDLNSCHLPYTTRWDKITYIFLKSCLNSNMKNGQRFIFFEREIYKKNLVN